MITIDYALRIYTDIIIAGNQVDMKYFQTNLSDKDFIEFNDLIPFINLLNSTKKNDKFQKVFNKVNAYKNDKYDMPAAANFRAKKDADSIKATQKLDELFNEEFGDE